MYAMLITFYWAIPLIHTYRIVRRNTKNKMATLLHFVKGCSHLAVKVQCMTLSCNQL